MAKLFLESTDTTYKVSSANTKVYGATGDQVVTVDAAATGVTFDANVEGVSFSGATSDFTYKQLGLTDLGVYKAGALYATVAIQDDATGSLLTFSNGTVATKFATAGGVTGLTFGGTAVSATSATTVTPATIDTTTGNGSTSTGVTGSTFTLTTSSTSGQYDNLTGTSGDDTFQALAFGSLEDGDLVAGGAGIDTLNARYDASAAGATSLTLNTTTTGIENVTISITKGDNAGDNITVDTANLSGLQSIVAKSDFNSNATAGDNLYTFTNVVSGVKAGVSAGVATKGADVTVIYASTSGTTDSETFTVADKAAAKVVTIAGIETVTVQASGTGNAITTLTAAAAKILKVTGTGAVSITATTASNALTAIDASGNTGGVTLGSSSSALADALTSVVGGTGNDTLTFTASNIADTDTINGGDGIDTINLLGGSLSSVHSVIKGFETLSITDTGNTYDVSKLTGSAITTVNVSSTGGTASVSNITTQATSLSGDNPTTVTLAAKTAASTVSVALANGATTTDGVDVDTLTATSNIATLNITSTDATGSLTSTDSNSAGGIGTETVTVNATAPTVLTFTGNTTKTINGADSTGTLTIDAGSAYANSTTKVGVAVTTGSGADTITSTAQNDTIVAGAGNDTVNISAGNDSIGLGAGDDSFVIPGASFSSLTGSTTINGGDGIDKISITAVAAGSYDFKGANSANLSGITNIEKFELNVADLINVETASLLIDDATLAVANNVLTLAVKDNASAVAGVIAVVDASSVVLSNGSVTLSATDFDSVLSYKGGNAKDIITGGTVADTFTFATTAYLSANDTINGGNGADTLVLSEAAAKTITAAQLSGLSSIGTINLDGVDGANAGAVSITLSAAVASAMAESNALTVTSLNVTGPTADDTGTITIDGSLVSSDVVLTLSGALSADTITGGAGNDIITGNAGNDSLTGGAGNDTFVAKASSGGIDKVSDFSFGTSTTYVDRLDFSAVTTITSLTLTNGAIFRSSTDSISAGDNIWILDGATYSSAAAVETAVDTIASTTATAGAIILWQDSLGNVHISTDTTVQTDSSGFVDQFILQGVSITGISSLVNATDFIV